jgi:hypothetical protein
MTELNNHNDTYLPDIDFSQDAPTPAAQLAKQGMRRAKGWEAATEVTVTEFGKAIKVWATAADEPVAPRPRQFASYSQAKMR